MLRHRHVPRRSHEQRSAALTTLQRLIEQKVLESDSANRAAIEPIRTDDQQFLAGKGSDKPIKLEWRSVTGLHFDPRSALADEIDLVFFRTPEQRLRGCRMARTPIQTQRYSDKTTFCTS